MHATPSVKLEGLALKAAMQSHEVFMQTLDRMCREYVDTYGHFPDTFSKPAKYLDVFCEHVDSACVPLLLGCLGQSSYFHNPDPQVEDPDAVMYLFYQGHNREAWPYTRDRIENMRPIWYTDPTNVMRICQKRIPKGRVIKTSYDVPVMTKDNWAQVLRESVRYFHNLRTAVSSTYGFTAMPWYSMPRQWAETMLNACAMNADNQAAWHGLLYEPYNGVLPDFLCGERISWDNYAVTIEKQCHEVKTITQA